MSKPAEASRNSQLPGRENVHPLFNATRFPPEIDYDAFYEPAVLATRLINSPQGLHYDYCFYFGKTVPAATPSGFSVEQGPDYLPYQYACDKAIGELTSADVEAVKRQKSLLTDSITFEIHDDIPPYAQTEISQSSTGEWLSTIKISRSVYNDALAKKRTPEQNARINLQIACIIIHEVAHAAHFHLFGPVREDYREESHIAEVGFEAVACLFGFTPKIKNDWNAWTTWQYRNTYGPYDLTKIGRKEWELPVRAEKWRMAPEFIMKLSDDDFWEGESGEYRQRGALALLPDDVPELCEPGNEDTHLYKAIPLSIRDLFRTEGPSYAKKKCASYSNPERQLRTRPEVDYRFKKLELAA